MQSILRTARPPGPDDLRPDLAADLEAIRREKVPERILTLARTLQRRLREAQTD